MEKFNTSEITRLIRSRRSIYPAQYSGEVIPQEIIEEILENANWAPTHKLTEPWRFTVFSGNGLKQLANSMAELYQKVTTARGTFEEKDFEKLQTKPLLASHIIAIAMKRDEKERLPEIEEIEAVACAVQNIYLTASAFGIGCYWGTGGITYFQESKELFGLDPKDKLLGFMFMGYPKGKWPNSKRKPIEDKVTWVE
ncbi:MAG: nitroreductase [Cyclobacteriaceae bacterium]|nr:nitroreductase [Cyclobacteriaceae bacterium]